MLYTVIHLVASHNLQDPSQDPILHLLPSLNSDGVQHLVSRPDASKLAFSSVSVGRPLQDHIIPRRQFATQL